MASSFVFAGYYSPPAGGTSGAKGVLPGGERGGRELGENGAMGTSGAVPNGVSRGEMGVRGTVLTGAGRTEAGRVVGEATGGRGVREGATGVA